MNKESSTPTLNERLYTAIEDATAGLFEEDVNYLLARAEAATACEKIALEGMLHVSQLICNAYVTLSKKEFEKRADEIKHELTNQLNELK
jgi:hypothetical protein